MQAKLQWSITSHWSEGPSSKNLQIINAGEAVKKTEHSHTVCGNANWDSHYGEQYGSFLNKTRATIWCCNPTPGLISKEKHN